MAIDETLKTRIESTIHAAPVVVFMKGTKNFPQCGFSATVVEVMKRSGQDFKDVNILQDPELREALKQYSNWPTYPQVYVHGELIGGCDIVREMFEKGELAAVLAKAR